MLDKIYMSRATNTAVFYFTHRSPVTATVSEDNDIENFLMWFLSNDERPLMTLKQWEATKEDTQIIDLEQLKRAS